MSREYKHYQLRSTPKPAKNPLVSTTVAIEGLDGKRYYCYVNFSETFVKAVGKKLSRGVSEFHPAMLFVRIIQEQYILYAMYISGIEECVELWRGVSKPPWLKLHPVKDKNGRAD